MDIDIILDNRMWENIALSDIADTAIAAVATQVNLQPETIEVSLLACDDARIAVLNAEFRDKPTPTNVLSWPAQDVTPPELPSPDFDGALALGDLALAFETCAREADAQNKTIEAHVTHLIVHGVLHLLGYDHESDIEATLMEGLEVAILGKLGVDDPYS